MSKLIRKGESGLDFSKAKTWEDIFNLINTDSRFKNRTYEQKVQSAKALLREILGGRFYSNGVSKPIGRSIELEEKPILGVSNEVSPSLGGQQIKLNIDLNEPITGDKKLNTPVVINNKELTTPIVIREAVTSLPSFLDWFTPKTPSDVSTVHSAVEEPKVLPLTNENAILSIGRLIPRPVTRQDVLKNPVKPVTPIIDVEKPVMIEYNGQPVLEKPTVETTITKTPEQISKQFQSTSANIVSKPLFKPITLPRLELNVNLVGSKPENIVSTATTLINKPSNVVKPVEYNILPNRTVLVSDFDANLNNSKIITNSGKAVRNYMSIASDPTVKKTSEKLIPVTYKEEQQSIKMIGAPKTYIGSDGKKYTDSYSGKKFEFKNPMPNNVTDFLKNNYHNIKSYWGFK